VVNDSFIQVRVVVGAILGVIRALVLGVGAERLFGRDGGKIASHRMSAVE
jgi:hypothetical protein